MVGLCFFFEDNDRDVWSGREIDLDAWRYAAKASGIDEMVVVNRTETPISQIDLEIALHVVQEVPELPGVVASLVCPWRPWPATSLWDFDHAVDWYVFGPADGWQQRPQGQLVTVPQAGLAALHAVHIASVVMLHRYEVLSRGR